MLFTATRALRCRRITRPWEVYTRAHLPRDWAMTQNNLGAVLREQGSRTGGETPGVQLLADAVTAYQLALEVYTRAPCRKTGP